MPVGALAVEPASTAGVGASDVVATKVRMPHLTLMRRERLFDLLSAARDPNVVLVVAPAGSGKTSLLADYVSNFSGPAAWYRAESWDQTPDALLRHLQAAFEVAIGDSIEAPWTSVEQAVQSLALGKGGRIVLAIDDLHTLEGTAAEGTLERFIECAPPDLEVMAASRTVPSFNLSRLRVSGRLQEVKADDLRFRSWEVEQLFRDFYQAPLPPVELADLTRRTGGWAAGLKLFHLAIRGKLPYERRRILSSLRGGSRLIREYLARNVIDELPEELRHFLIDSCVLGRLTGGICNRFLARLDSDQLLDELERRQIFIQALDDDAYRYHEVLRSYLDDVAVQELGEVALRERYRKAGDVLARAGAEDDALRAYSRGGDWRKVGQLLRQNGERLHPISGLGFEGLPVGALRHDPWLMLAKARQHRAEGSWPRAIDTYVLAETAFGSGNAADICKRERQALASWLSPAPVAADGLLGLLRAAVSSHPLSVARQTGLLEPAAARMATGLCALFAGNLADARPQLKEVRESPAASEPIVVGAHVADAAAAVLAGDSGVELGRAVEMAESSGMSFLARLGRLVTALQHGAGGAAEAAQVRCECEDLDDHWGAAAALLVTGWALAKTQQVESSWRHGAEELGRAADAFRELHSGVMEAWARALQALVLAPLDKAAAGQLALEAERLAGRSGVDGPLFFCYLALATCNGDRDRAYGTLARSVCIRSGLSHPIPKLDKPIAFESTGAPSISIRCFGGLQMSISGSRVDVTALKPRVRSLLRLLAINGGRLVHREILQQALWPNADAESSSRNLHVAISTLRLALEPGITRGGSSLVVREGDAYCLKLPEGADVDLLEFEKAIAAGRSARARGDSQASARAFDAALERYTAELLPEEGPADWLIERRDACSAAGVEAAHILAGCRLSDGDASGSAEAALRGLRIDRFADPLWRLLIEARTQAGDLAAAAQAQADYERMLREVGATFAPQV